VWARWKGIFKSKVQKIKKKPTKIEMELLEKRSFLKTKKITNEQQTI
jgi:hypothetical protein